MLSRIYQHCLFYSHPAHHYLRQWREPEPSLQWGRPQPKVLSTSDGATHPDRKPWASTTTPDQGPYTPAPEYTSHSLWGGRGRRKSQRQTGRETWGAHRRWGMLKNKKRRNADWRFLSPNTTLCTHGHHVNHLLSTVTSTLEINSPTPVIAGLGRNWTMRKQMTIRWECDSEKSRQKLVYLIMLTRVLL